MRGEPVPHPRRIGRHVAAIIDMLMDGGASSIRVFKTRHVIIQFSIGRHNFEIRSACTPRSIEHAIAYAKAEIKRLVEDALVDQLAGLP